MRIQKIAKLDYARFRNSSWDSALNPLCDGINIVFGWNGSGKTTLAKFFRSIEKQSVDSQCSFKITTDSGQFSESSNLTGIADKIRVFNDDYVDETLSGSPKFPYIFFAGKEAVEYAEDEKRLDAKRTELGKFILPSRHDEIARDTADRIRKIPGINAYKKELTGGNYASYDKTDFEKRVKEIRKRIRSGELQIPGELTRKDIDKLTDQLQSSERLKRVDERIAVAAQWFIDNIEAVNSTLQSTPVQKQSERIGSMDKKQTEWIEHGVELHFNAMPRHEACLFCNSRIENADELLQHFSTEVVQTLKSVDGYLGQIEEYTSDLARIDSPTQPQAATIAALRADFDNLTTTLRRKRDTVTRSTGPVALDTQRIRGLIATEPPDMAATAYAIEVHYVSEKYEEYETASAEFERASQEKRTLEDEVRALQERVRTLKQKARNTHEPASALNRLFKVVFPYRKIEIANSDDETGYVLRRDGAHCAFSSLSEGEKNFIALAYFVRSLNDAQNKLADNGVVIIDDPVSSLDKQAIFQIFSTIVNEMNQHRGRQYLLLTHSLDFLGHLKAHFDKAIKKTKKNRTVSLFSLEATNAGCAITEIPALLKNHRSDYYYVFSVLHRFRDNCDVEDAHLVVNLLRRWLETFLEFKFSTSGDLRSTLESAYAEARKKTEKWKMPFGANHLEMYRFISHGSHGFVDTESTDDSILTNASQRIQEAFQLVQILDKLHYKKLSQGVQDKASAEGV